MKSGYFKVILISMFVIFSLTTARASLNPIIDNPLDCAALKEAIDTSITNLELIPDISKLPTIEFYQNIIAQIHFSTSSVIGEKEASPSFYEIGTFFLAAHFNRNKLAKSILLEERRYTNNILIKSWIESELLVLEKIELLKHIKQQNNNFKLRLPKFKANFEEFERLTQKTNSVLYSEKHEFIKNHNIAMLSEILHDEAEQLSSEGKVQSAIQKFDLSSSLLAKISDSESSFTGAMIMSARSISDMGQFFQALVRYKKLLLNSTSNIDPIVVSIIYEDIADIYSQLHLYTKATDYYHKAMNLNKNNKSSYKRLKLKLMTIEN